MKQHIYFIPGMSACSKIFERIQLPTQFYEIHFLEWLMPLQTNEDLKNYINRLSKELEHKPAMFIGVSFGGIIAQELGKIHPNTKVVIISSIKHQNELSPFLKGIKYSKLYKLYPVYLVPYIEKLLYKLGSKQIKRSIYSYQNYLPIRNFTYTKWAIKTFLNWTNNNPIPVTHIHGNSDTILPIKHIQPNVITIKGSHAIIITMASTIQQEIIKAMA